AAPDGGINSPVLASGCCPVRFDLDHSLFSGLKSKAADRSVRSTQTLAAFFASSNWVISMVACVKLAGILSSPSEGLRKFWSGVVYISALSMLPQGLKP